MQLYIFPYDEGRKLGADFYYFISISWTHRESDPDFLVGNEMFYHLTSSALFMNKPINLALKDFTLLVAYFIYLFIYFF